MILFICSKAIECSYLIVEKFILLTTTIFLNVELSKFVGDFCAFGYLLCKLSSFHSLRQSNNGRIERTFDRGTRAPTISIELDKRERASGSKKQKKEEKKKKGEKKE